MIKFTLLVIAVMMILPFAAAANRNNPKAHHECHVGYVRDPGVTPVCRHFIK